MKQYNSWQGYKRLLTFIKPYKTRLVFAVICMALSGASNVVVPWLIKDVIDKVLANKDIYTLNLIVIGILVLVFTARRLLLWRTLSHELRRSENRQ